MSSQFADALVYDLVEAGLLAEEKHAEALREQQERGGPLCDIVVAKGMATEEQLLEVFAKRHNVEYVTHIDVTKILNDVVNLVPSKLCVYYDTIPLERNLDELTIAIVDPLNIFALDDLQVMTGHKIKAKAALKSEVSAAIQHFYGGGDENYEEFFKAIMPEFEDMEVVEQKIELDVDQQEDVMAAAVVKLVNVLLTQALEERASDIHIEQFEKKVTVRYRIDGVLYERQSPPFQIAKSMVTRIKIMLNLDISERRLPHEGRFRIKTKGREVDFSVSIVPTPFGENVVMRVLGKSSANMAIEMLEMEPTGKARMMRALDKPNGMFIVTGPTGSGKTTTLYACLNHLNSPNVKIVTTEDPIEYHFPGINQVVVNTDIGLTFAKALRSALRQDPDVVMVGDIRDLETADIAVKTALAGRIVFSALHTDSAAATFARITDLGVEPLLTASAINLVMAQRLGRRLCEKCRKPVDMKRGVLGRAQYRPFEGIAGNFHAAAGCDACRHTGYKGRIGLFEVLVVTDEIRRMVVAGADTKKIKDVAVKQGMLTLRQCGLWWAAQGVTSIEEALRVTASD